ncbi:MAG: MFS transporter, partial [Chloroflexi bacterium]|nr:MFS transporter [Chloroflexota bacterium]
MIKRRRFPRIFPGWGVVATGGFINLWGGGYHAYGFSALFNPIAKELNLSRAVTSVASSIDRIGAGIEAPLIGWITDRFGPRRVILFGVFLFGFALILMNFVNSLWAFYLVWGVMLGAGNNASSGVPMSTAIANWFVKKRGLALGVRMMISAVFLLPLVTWLITTQGWRIACVVGGVVMLVVGLLLTWFFIRDRRPEYYGLLPDGATVEEEVRADSGRMIEKGVAYATEVKEVEFTLRQAMRTPAYWLLIVANIGPSVTSGALMVHFIPLLTDMGLSPTRAATAMTLAGFSSPVARFTSGLLADRFRKEHLRFLLGGTYLLQATGIVIFVLNQTLAMVYPFLILYFVCLGVNFIVSPSIGARYFGRKAIGSIQGTSVIMTVPIGMLAPVYLGWVYDTTGSYG